MRSAEPAKRLTRGQVLSRPGLCALGGVLALLSGLGGSAVASEPSLPSLPSVSGMEACRLEVEPGKEIPSLVCLTRNLAYLSPWEKRGPAEQAWHTSANRAAFELARQAYRTGHGRAAELFYGAALVSVYGVPHTLASQAKQPSCDAALRAMTFGCRVDACRVDRATHPRAQAFSEVSKVVRYACLKPLPEACGWDEKVAPPCGEGLEPIRREWARYSEYVAMLPRLPALAESLMPPLERWRQALEAYEEAVYPAFDAGKLTPDFQAFAPVLEAGLAARRQAEGALLQLASARLARVPPAVRSLLPPLLQHWRALLAPGVEPKGFEALALLDSRVEAARSAVEALSKE